MLRYEVRDKVRTGICEAKAILIDGLASTDKRNSRLTA